MQTKKLRTGGENINESGQPSEPSGTQVSDSDKTASSSYDTLSLRMPRESFPLEGTQRELHIIMVVGQGAKCESRLGSVSRRVTRPVTQARI